MSNGTDTQVIENEPVVEQEQPAIPVVKTKKEIKKERKELKKHKKQVKKEALKHSAKATKAYNFMITVISLLVIASLLFCSYTAIQITKNFNNSEATVQDGGNSSDSGNGTDNQQSNASAVAPDANNPSDSGEAVTNEGTAPSADEGGDSGEAATPLGSKADVVEYYKTAHAKVLSEAKSVTRTYDNTTNYEGYLEVGGNSSLATVAKTLMGMFMKENTEEFTYSGADIAANFPSTNNSCAGLTPDMIGEYSVTEEGDNYIVTIAIDSSKEVPDLGEKSAHIVSIVQSKQVEDAAKGYVEFSGLENRYFAPKVIATINKTTGQMTALETDAPSYMCFASATVLKFITVDNVGIGLEYQQKWTVEW